MATTPLVTVIECLTEVLGMAVADHPELATKLRHAARVVDANLERHIFPDNVENGDYWVDSETQDGVVYSTNIVTGACTCKAAQYSPGPCKHVLAVRLVTAASYLRNERQRALDYGRAPLPGMAEWVAQLAVA